MSEAFCMQCSWRQSDANEPPEERCNECGAEGIHLGEFCDECGAQDFEDVCPVCHSDLCYSSDRAG